MTNAADGPRVPLVERDELAESERSIYDHVASSRGGDPNRMGNGFKALANSPRALHTVPAGGDRR